APSPRGTPTRGSGADLLRCRIPVPGTGGRGAAGAGRHGQGEGRQRGGRGEQTPGRAGGQQQDRGAVGGFGEVSPAGEPSAVSAGTCARAAARPTAAAARARMGTSSPRAAAPARR